MPNARLVAAAIGLSIFGTAAAAAQSAATGNFSGRVDVGGRKIHVECKGAGAPTVILISGYRNNAEIWTVEPGPGLTPVFAAVAQFTRVCVYDRPGTVLDAERRSRSDPVPMPRSADAIVAELHATLGAAGINGPYVLAAHSLGGLFARLYTATDPQEIAGLVLVDAWQEDLEAILGPAQWAAYVELATPPPPGIDYPDLESVDFAAASARMREAAKAAPLPPMPLLVISRGKPVQLPPHVPAAFSPDAFEVAWREGQRRLGALLPDARQQIAAESNHYVQLGQPGLVSEAIRAVVDAVHDPALWTSNDKVAPVKAAGGSPAPSTKIAPAPAERRDFAGLVDIGGGRKMFLECRGTGSPTVVLISGKGVGAGSWNEVLDPADPTHEAHYDTADYGRLRESESAVLPAVSRFTRVCAYDRPGTVFGLLASTPVSTPVAQPHTVDQAVRDLRMLLAAAGETGPYLLVPHSYGGFVALLYARTHPDEVAGFVMVDAGADYMKRVVSAEALADWDASGRITSADRHEAVELLDAIEKINAASPLPKRPAIVLSADKPWEPEAPDAQGETAGGAKIMFADWLAAQDLLAASLHAKHVAKTNSGHFVYLYEPQLVVDAVREVFDEVRSNDGRQPSPGLIDIGGGRKMYLECRGAGSPTIVLVSGKGNRADIWSTPSQDKPGPTVFAEVTKLTRVCTYDRPGTTGALASEPSRSDAVPEPVTIADGAADLRALLAAARVPGPYVLAGHSMGGLISRLFASRYGDQVAGLVLIDALSEDLYNGLTAEQRAVFERLNGAPERYDNIRSFEQIRAAAAVRPLPVVVLTAGRRPITAEDVASGRLPPDVTADFADALWAAQVPAQDKLAKLFPNARHVTIKESGHYIQLDRPQLVIDAIRDVVGAVRDPATWPGSDTATDPGAGGEFAGLVDIGGGRKMYLTCRGKGSPTVVLIAGLKASADDWNITRETAPTVFSGVADATRVCAYDRPGTPVGEEPSRSDPVPQPTTAADAVADLHTLLSAAHEPAPYVVVGHSYGGLIAKLYARTYPRDAGGLVLVDALTEGLQEAETRAQWATQRVLMEGDIRESVALYPALERIDPDRSFDQVRAAPPLRPLPLIVLSADRPWGPQVPDLIANGTLPADVPADFGYITDAAQKKAQAQLAVLVPGARHITDTDSGHEIHKEQPRLVTDAILAVVDAVRAGKTRLDP